MYLLFQPTLKDLWIKITGNLLVINNEVTK